MKLSLSVPPCLSVGPKKWLKKVIIGIGGLMLVCTPVSAAGLMGPNASAIPTKAVGDSLRITDFNALLDVARKLFVDEKTAGTADDLVGLGTYTADTVTCPAGTTHVDFNDNATVEAGECFSGVTVVDGKLGVGTTSPEALLFVKSDQSTDKLFELENYNGIRAFSIGSSTLQAQFYGSGTINSPQISFIGNTTTGLGAEKNLGIALLSNGNKALFADTDGKVGIGGTTTPTEALDVVGNIAVSGTVDGVDVSGLSTMVGTNTSDIATNASDISTNASGIEDNGTAIATNADNIATNTLAIAGKADLVTGATVGNLAGLDVDGNLTDSGFKLNDLGTTATDLWSADQIQSAITSGVGTVTEVDTLGTVTGRGNTTSEGINLNGTLNDLTKGLSFGDADTGFYEYVDDQLRLNLGGSPKIIFRTTDVQFGVDGATNGRFKISTPTATEPNIVPIGDDGDTGIGWAGANQLSLIAGGVEGIRVNTATTGVNYLDVTPSATTDAVQIATGGTDTNIDLALMPKGTGNVGIGTTTPIEKLDVSGNIKVGLNNYLQFSTSANQISSNVWKTNRTAGFTFQLDAEAPIIFKTNSIQRMVIDSAGNVGIGDTTPDGTLKLDVEGQIGSTGYCDENGANCKTIAELSDTGSDNQTLDEVLTQGATTTQTMTVGNILPEMTGATGTMSTRTLGSATQWFADLYAEEVHIGANSLYVNGKKVIHDNSDTMTFSTDIDQNVKMYTSGTGGLTLESQDTGNLYLKKSGTNGNLQIESSTNATISAVSGISLTIPNTAPAGNHIYLTNNDTDGKIYLNASGITLTSTTPVDVQAGLSATGAITGASFNGVTLTDGGSGALTVNGTASISGSNTGDETTATIKTKLGAATTSTDGYLTSTDWNTFNSKQEALTNPVTGTGTINYLPKFTGTSAIGDSLVFDNGTNVGIGTVTPAEKLDVAGNIAVSGTVDGVDVSDLSAVVTGNTTNINTNTAALITKAKKVTGATVGNLAGLDADGDLTDSGLALNDSGTSTTDLWSASKIGSVVSSAGTLQAVTDAGATTTNAITTAGLTVDTDTLFVDATNNRVGIGTATPGAKMHIYDSNPTIRETVARDTTTGYVATAFEQYAYQTTNELSTKVGVIGTYGNMTGGVDNAPYAKYMYLGVDADTAWDSGATLKIGRNGKVGINVPSSFEPAYDLDIHGSNGIVNIQGLSPRFLLTDTNGKGWQVRADNDDLTFWGNNANTNYVTFQDGGNVGIGTATPGVKLTVSGGDISLGGADEGGNNLIWRQRSGGSGDLGIYEESYGLQMMAPDNIIIGIDSNNNDEISKFAIIKDTKDLYANSDDVLPATTLFTVQSNGNVGIGTADPTAQVHVQGNLTTALTGTVTVTAASDAVTGTGTAFDTELSVGDSIKIGTEVFTVSAIGSATSLTLDSNHTAGATDATAYADSALLALDTGDGVNKVTVTKSGDITLPGTVDGVDISELQATVLANKPSTFVGKTSGTHTGNLGTNGYRSGNDLCAADFAGSHLCSQTEIMYTIETVSDLSTLTGWSGDVWLSTGGAKYSPAALPVNDCNGWTHGVGGTYLGNFWRFDLTTGGSGKVSNCGVSFNLACCK